MDSFMDENTPMLMSTVAQSRAPNPSKQRLAV